MLLYHNNSIYSNMFTLEQARDSYESEWASVYYGLLFSIQKDAQRIHIENDNQGVVTNLSRHTYPSTQQRAFVQDYRDAILDLVKQTEWTGIRWIPRRYNRADDLFHTANKLRK